MRKSMNIYITTGRQNLKYAYVAIKSLFVNNKEREVHLYVVSENLTLDSMPHEIELAKEYGHQIHILPFDEEVAGKYIHIDQKDHWPIGTMSSYWLFHELLPKEVDRIMVIESDTVVVDDLSEIYDMDFEDAYVICPGPEHKPANHRNFMEKIGGDTLTFVLSMYNVQKIREDFTLMDILNTDGVVKAEAGYSQMEFTFGLLFKDRIKYVPGRISCIDENERYAEELGYDYIVECMKTAKILHFSSYRDYSKPWNPVSIMPGYAVWWDYAQGSPYYKEYFEEQWRLYDKVKQEKRNIMKNISYRNVLLCAMMVFYVFLNIYSIAAGHEWAENILITLILILSIAVSIGIRQMLIWIQTRRNR